MIKLLPHFVPPGLTVFLTLTLIWCLMPGCSLPRPKTQAVSGLSRALTFHASFDGQTAADFGAGDRQLFWASSMKQPRIGKPGLPDSGVVSVAHGQGRFGDALRFHKKVPDMVFYHAEKNMRYKTNDWNGTVSFWLRVDPGAELAPGFCDPIQITPREWNDAAFFVEFEKKAESIPFRLGAYADLKVWNPSNREWNSIPFAEKPLAAVENPPFGGDRWTHVLFTFEHFNTGQKDGVAKLYLNGALRGSISSREQTYRWDPAQARVMLGLNYIGLFDELALFNRALSPEEVQQLYRLDGGVHSLTGPLALD